MAAALATIAVYEEDELIEHTRKMGDVMARHHQELKDKHPSVGAVRNIGLFGALDLVKNRETMEPMSPFNVTNDVMASVNRFLLDNGLYTLTHWWTLMTNPPLPITEEQLSEGFEIIDRGAPDRRRGRGGVAGRGSVRARPARRPSARPICGAPRSRFRGPGPPR